MITTHEDALHTIVALRGYKGADMGRVAGYRVAAEIAEKALADGAGITAAGLRNLLAAMLNIDRHEIEAAGYDMPDGSWSHFQENPWRRFLECNDQCREAIVRVMNSRGSGGHS